MSIGWISLHRKLLNNPIVCKDSDYMAVWIYLLLNATHAEYDTIFKGNRITLKAGQLITGRDVISKKFKINSSKTQRILKKLENEQQIEQQTSNVNRLISIVNWSEYQDSEQRNEQQVNNKRTTSEQQVNTNNNVNNAKNDNKGPSLNKFVLEIFPEGMTNDKDFIEVWTDFEQVRKKKKAAVSARAYKALFNSLDKLSCGDLDLAIDIVAQSADKGYPNFYELPKEKK